MAARSREITSSSSDAGRTCCSGVAAAADGFLYVARPGDLRHFTRAVGALHELELGFDPADGTPREVAQARLMALHNECGCTAASAAFLIAAGALAVARWEFDLHVGWWALLGAALGASIVTKVVVLVLARARLSRLARRYGGV